MKHIFLAEKISIKSILVVILVIYFLFWTALVINKSVLRRKLDTAQLYLSSIAEATTIKNKIEAREDFLVKMRVGKLPVGGLLRLISVITPAEAVLDTLSLDQTKGELYLEGLIFKISSDSDLLLEDYIKNLEDTKFFKKAVLVSSRNSGDVKQFEIKCDLEN